MVTAAIGTAVSLGLSALSGALTPTQNVFNETEVGKLDNVSTRKTGAGWTLGKVYGRVQINGCPIFWAPERREEVVTTTESTRSGGSKFGGGTTTTNQTNTYKYYGTFAFAICDGGAGIDVRQIKFNDKVWYNKDGQLNGTIADNDYKLENYLKIYSGTSNQSIDPTIQNYEGNQNGDRNFRHLVYCVVTDFPLDEFGGELPTGIDVVVLRDDTTGDQPYNRIDKVIYEAAETVGLVPGVDVKCDGLLNSVTNGARDLRINGVFKQDGTSAADFINEIVQRYFLMTYLDDDGAIVFDLPENFDDQVVKYWANLGVVEYGNDPGDPYSEIMPDESELPSSVTLNYQNINDDFNSDNEIKLYTIAEHYNPKSINSSLYLVPDEAKWWVWKYLQLAWQQARRFTINLLPEDTVQLTEGFKLLIPLTDNGSMLTFTIASIVVGSNLTAEIELYQYEGNIFTASPDVSIQTNEVYNGSTIQLNDNITVTPLVTNAGGTITYVEGIDYSVNTTTGELVVLGGSSIQPGDSLNITYTAEPDFTVDSYNPDLEIPDYGEPVVTIVETNRIRLNDNPCIYASIAKGGDGFNATTIYSRVDGGSYGVIGSALTPTTQGTLSGTLALASGLDEVNTATVVLSEGVLEQLTQNQFDNQETILLIGDEQIIARDVTLIAANTYELSYLQRGVNGTPPVAHVNGESVYLAKGGTGQLLIFAADASLIGSAIDVKAVPINSDLTTVTTVTNHTIEGIYFKPYAVTGVTSTKDSAGNITINWTANDTGKDALIPQSFEVDIYDGVNIVRTLNSNESNLRYLVADQITDFGVAQSAITIALYQLSTEYGRGYVYSDILSPILLDPLPTILGFSPTQGAIGDTVTVYGFGFTSALSVTANGTQLDSLTIVSDEVITGVIADGTTSGKIAVTNTTGTTETLVDFAVVNSISEWGDIQGEISDQSDLWSILQRTRIWTYLSAGFTVPNERESVNVQVDQDFGFGIDVPVAVFRQSFVGDPNAGGYAQLSCSAVTTNESGIFLTLENTDGIITETTFLTGDIIIPIYSGDVSIFGGISKLLSDSGYATGNTFYDGGAADTVSVDNIIDGGNAGTTEFESTLDASNASLAFAWGDITGTLSNQTDLQAALDAISGGIVDSADKITGVDTAGNSKYYGTNESGTAGFYDLPSGGGGSTEKTQNKQSISTTKSLNLLSEYYQFLTPTVASVIVKLPIITSTDYFECEIVNISTSNALEIQEHTGTAVITLENANDKARSIYAYWDGTTWQVWIRGYY